MQKQLLNNRAEKNSSASKRIISVVIKAIIAPYTLIAEVIRQRKEACKAHPHGLFYHGNLEKYLTFRIYNQLNKMTKTYKS